MAAKGTTPTSSGHGAMGMGGQPDDPRDLEGGHEGLTNEGRPKAVDGASGGRNRDVSGGSVTGVPGDKGVIEGSESEGRS